MRITLPKTVGARELKTRLGRYLRGVRDGATIVVTERDTPVAELRPIASSRRGLGARLDELSAIGLLTKGKGGALAVFKPLRLGGGAMSETLHEER